MMIAGENNVVKNCLFKSLGSESLIMVDYGMQGAAFYNCLFESAGDEIVHSAAYPSFYNCTFVGFKKEAIS